MRRALDGKSELSSKKRSFAAGILAVAAMAGSVLLFPPGCDADFAHPDGASYADRLDACESVLNVLHPNHPLTHALAVPIRVALAEAGVSKPGRIAARIVAGAGLSVVVILIVTQATSWLIGSLFAVSFMLSRGTILAAGTGEALLAAYAAVLGAAMLSVRTPPRLGCIALLLTFALLLRQDSLLFIPGIVGSAALGLPSGQRLRPLMFMVAVVGSISLCAYVALWIPFRAEVSLLAALLGVGGVTSWSGADGFEASMLIDHLAALGDMAVGRVARGPALQIVAGTILTGFLVLAAQLYRGNILARRFLLMTAIAITVRYAFYSWFEPKNPEWHIATLMLIAAAGAHLTAGIPATSRRCRLASHGILGMVIAAVMILHGPFTLQLRRFDLSESAAAATTLGGRSATYFVLPGGRMALAIKQLGFTPITLPDDMEDAGELVLESIAQTRGPLFILRDAFALDGAPASLKAARTNLLLESLSVQPGITAVHWKGQLIGVATGLDVPRMHSLLLGYERAQGRDPVSVGRAMALDELLMTLGESAEIVGR